MRSGFRGNLSFVAVGQLVTVSLAGSKTSDLGQSLDADALGAGGWQGTQNTTCTPTPCEIARRRSCATRESGIDCL